jgi:hypothetical protein
MSLPLQLNCVVHGDDPSRVFPVQIAGTESVGTLKEVIKDKKKQAFADVHADALDIYKVSFPVDALLDAKLKRFRPEDEGDHLLSNTVIRLKEVFDDSIDRHLHAIVLRPPACE